MAEHCFFCGHMILGEEGCEACGTVRHARSERRVRAKCPRCGDEARLVPFGVGDASLQACARCKGMFASAPDWDTLLDVFSQEPFPDVVIPDAEGASTYGPYRSAPTSARVAEIDLDAPVRCPTCDAPMDRIEFAAISRIIIDVCSDHGVWLDAGELERIIESFHPHPLPEPVVHEPVKHERSFSIPRTMAEAAAEPIVPSASEPSHLAPMEPGRVIITPDARLPWTAQLGRALARLMRMIAPR